MPSKNTARDLDLPYLVELLKPKHKIVRVLWLLVFLSMISISIYLIYLLVNDYRKFSSFNLVSVENIGNFTLPAFTICSLSVINASQVDDSDILDAYYELADSHKRLNETGEEGEDAVDDDEALEIYLQNTMKIERMILRSETTFGKRDTRGKRFNALSNFHFTELGRCMDINDDASLVQQVEGPEGGLVLVLDANIEHYLANVEEQGFYITLRMPNETIVTKNFGFAVSPGEQVLINIEKFEVERLGKPWGKCKNEVDLFSSGTAKNNDILTKKECFLLQKLWSYFREPKCACFPWYFWERFFSIGKGQYDGDLDDRLLKYFTYDLPDNKRIRFNETCKSLVPKDATIYESNDIKLLDNVKSIQACAGLCRNETTCILFMYATEDNDFLKREQCQLFKESAKQVLVEDGKKASGLYRGAVNCTGDLKVCGLSRGMKCEDDIMRNIMSKNTYFQPFECSENCQYDDYRFSLSRSTYPAEKYWENYLSKTYTYRESYEDTRKNLIKLVFYTQRMQLTKVTQTPSYEIQSFVGELGGLTDLFIGISFFTLFQILDLLLTRMFKAPPKNEKANRINSGHLALEDV